MTAPTHAAARRKARPAPPPLAPATISECDGVRYLHLGTPWVQGAMRLRRSLWLELEYVQRMMVWMLLRPSDEVTAGHAVQLGLGAAAITRYCHSTLRMRTTAVELNPTVVDACRLWFHLPQNSSRLQVVQMDAGEYVADAALAGSADALCVDLYDQDAASPVLDSAAFYAGCHRLLADGGVMSVNLFGRDAGFERSARRIAAAFGEGQVWALRPTKEGNTVLVALRGAEMPGREALAVRADRIEARFKLQARKWLRMIRPFAEAGRTEGPAEDADAAQSPDGVAPAAAPRNWPAT